MPYTTLSEFKSRNGITVTTFDAQLTFLLNTFSDVIDEEVGPIFSLSTKTSADEMRYYGQPAGATYVQTPVWQATDLIVKQGCFGSADLTTLTKNVDYYLVPVLHKTNPIIGIKLPHTTLNSNQFLQLEGSFGFSDGLPATLTMLLDQAVLAAMNYRLRSQNQMTKSKGYQLESERSGNLSVSFGSNPEMDKYGSALNSGNLLAVPEISNNLSYYKSLLIKDTIIT